MPRRKRGLSSRELRFDGPGAGCGAALGLAAICVARSAERSVGVDGARVVAYLTAVAAGSAIGYGGTFAVDEVFVRINGKRQLPEV